MRNIKNKLKKIIQEEYDILLNEQSTADREFELHRRLDPTKMIMHNAMDAAYKKQPYKLDTQSLRQTIAKLKPEDMLGFQNWLAGSIATNQELAQTDDRRKQLVAIGKLTFNIADEEYMKKTGAQEEQLKTVPKSIGYPGGIPVWDNKAHYDQWKETMLKKRGENPYLRGR